MVTVLCMARCGMARSEHSAITERQQIAMNSDKEFSRNELYTLLAFRYSFTSFSNISIIRAALPLFGLSFNDILKLARASFFLPIFIKLSA